MGTTAKFSQSNKQAMRNPWVIGWIIAIILVLLVNIIFVTTAILTNPGLVDENYYEKGRNHEAYIQDKIQARNKLGWQLKLEKTTTNLIIGQPTNYHFSLVNQAGLPIEKAEVILTAYRPSDAKADIKQPMMETVPGIYTTKIIFPLKGLWEVTVNITQGENKHSLSRRVNVYTQ